MPNYYVRIPYWHRFTVEADSPEQAIQKAHDQEGVIEGYDDDLAEVEERNP